MLTKMQLIRQWWSFPFLIFQADGDKDGRLTLTEMIESPYVFYTGVLSEDDDGDEYEIHDEFR